jgi:hypothetical protein
VITYYGLIRQTASPIDCPIDLVGRDVSVHQIR